MKNIAFNKKELSYILKGLYSVQQSYSGYNGFCIYDLKNFKNVRAIISKIKEVDNDSI